MNKRTTRIVSIILAGIMLFSFAATIISALVAG